MGLHTGYDGKLYNDIDGSTVSTIGGSSELSIHQIPAKVSRDEVLLDVARLKGLESWAAGDAIFAADFAAAGERQGVLVGPDDVLIRRLTHEHSAQTFWNGSPGIDVWCLEWL